MKTTVHTACPFCVPRRRASAHVPWLWYYEIANALFIQVHRKRAMFEEVKAFLSLIGEMPTDVDAPDELAIHQLA